MVTWSRTAALVALLLLIPAASASTPPLPPVSVWTVHVTIEADVEDHYATVTVRALIANRGPDPEFPFVVQVPSGAFVTGLKVTRDGVTEAATVAEREAARAAYEEHKAAEQTGALVEKQRNSDLYAYLVNVEAAATVVAELTYETYLQADQGVYSLPLEAPVSGFGQDLGADFRITLRHAEGVQAAWGEPRDAMAAQGTAPAGATADGVTGLARADGSGTLRYAVGPRGDDGGTPLHVKYQVGAAPDAGRILTATTDEGGVFVHRFSAPPDADALPLDMVLVLDTSGSMNGQKIEQLRDATRQLIQALGPDDRLQIVTFSTGAQAAWAAPKTMDEAGRAAALQIADGLLAAGSTNIADALRAGFGAFTAPDGAPVLVVLTDGRPTVGETDPATLRAIARDANRAEVSVYGVAFGADASWGLVHGLADDGGGTALRVQDGAGAEVDLRRFFQALTTPTLRDLRVAYEDGVEALRVGSDILFSGSEVLFVGRFGDLERIRGTVTAEAPDGPRSYTFDVPVTDGPGYVERVVAYHEIQDLAARIDAGEAGLRDPLVDRALRHGFVTDHTSLVLTMEARPFDPTLPIARTAGSTLDRFRSDQAADPVTWNGMSTMTATMTQPPATAYAVSPSPSIAHTGTTQAPVVDIGAGSRHVDGRDVQGLDADVQEDATPGTAMEEGRGMEETKTGRATPPVAVWIVLLAAVGALVLTGRRR